MNEDPLHVDVPGSTSKHFALRLWPVAHAGYETGG
jgi:hypothetical protein